MKLVGLARTAAALAVSALLLAVAHTSDATAAAAATPAATTTTAADVAAPTLDHDAHLVTDLPGLEPADATFKHYAGHLELATREKLFYWYTESQESPETAPVVLWLNGGPGCSSLGGFFTENGPFVVNADLSVRLNRHAWNRKANVVWLESPAGVGFSGPVQDASYYNDDVVAAKAREFLGRFFAQYPELQNRKFYITGESYAGMYIPYLVDLLVREPLEHVAFAGFAIGNAYTDNQIDNSAYVDYFYSHGLISLENYREMQRVCSRANIGCVYTGGDCTPECRAVLEEGILAMDEDQYDPYFIYGDKCLLSANQATALQLTLARQRSNATDRLSRPSRSHRRLETAASWSERTDIAPCADTFTQMYLNQLSVQQAIHVVAARGDAQALEWASCSDPVGDLYTSSDSSLGKYRNFLGKGLEILIYSGDADSVVNFIGTQRWISEEGLQLRVTSKWKAWFGPDNQLAGYVQGYDGLTFKTVKGAGHMVPAVKPLHALYMIECFVFGDAACATFTYPIDLEEIEAGAFSSATALNAVATPVHTVWLAVAALVAVVAAVAAIAVKTLRKRSEYDAIRSSV